MTKERRVVYVEVQDRNPFGEEVAPEVFQDPAYTSNYIPGWSEERHQNELRKAKGEPIVPLKCRFHWARCRDIQDTEKSETRRVQHWKQKHYVVPDYDDVVKNMGYDLSENLAITKGADNKAHWGEHILVMASAEVAAAHYQKQQEKNAAQTEQSTYTQEELVTGSSAKENVFARDDSSQYERR